MPYLTHEYRNMKHWKISLKSLKAITWQSKMMPINLCKSDFFFFTKTAFSSLKKCDLITKTLQFNPQNLLPRGWNV